MSQAVLGPHLRCSLPQGTGLSALETGERLGLLIVLHLPHPASLPPSQAGQHHCLLALNSLLQLHSAAAPVLCKISIKSCHSHLQPSHELQAPQSDTHKPSPLSSPGALLSIQRKQTDSPPGPHSLLPHSPWLPLSALPSPTSLPDPPLFSLQDSSQAPLPPGSLPGVPKALGGPPSRPCRGQG